MMMKTTMTAVMNDYQLQKMLPLSTQKLCTGFPSRLHVHPTTEKTLSRVKKTTAVLKRAMTEKSDRWQSRDWYGNTKTRRQQTAGGVGGQSSHDTWDTAKPKGMWKEISAEIDAMETAVKDKKNTWHKSGRESLERETELFTMVESAATDEKTGRKRSM